MPRPALAFGVLRSRVKRAAPVIAIATFALLAAQNDGVMRTPVPTPPPTPLPTLTPGLNPIRVTSIPALLTALADNTVDEIVVANGTYHVSPSGQKKPDSLWIGGDKFASRTRPIFVRAETIGGVTFDGTGETGGLRRPQLRGRRTRPDLGRLQASPT